MTAAELRELVNRLRLARNVGLWHTEQVLWAELADAINRMEYSNA